MSGKPIDITGKKFGKLTVISMSGHDKIGHSTIWLCKCDCGSETNVRQNQLNSGKTKSCGCLRKGCQILDLKGKRFNKLLVLEFSHVNGKRQALFKCICDCGNECIKQSYLIQNGYSTSCGCVKSPDKKIYDDAIRTRIHDNILIDNKGCWNWKGTSSHGYGLTNYRKNNHAKVHRLSYELFKGEIPKNLWVLHKCDNRLCCNPDHLYIGTHKDNVNDMIERNRCNKGSDRPLAKLNEEKVIYCRFLYKNGFSIKSMSQFFGVTSQTMGYAIHGRTWGHI